MTATQSGKQRMKATIDPSALARVLVPMVPVEERYAGPSGHGIAAAMPVAAPKAENVTGLAGCNAHTRASKPGCARSGHWQVRRESDLGLWFVRLAQWRYGLLVVLHDEELHAVQHVAELHAVHVIRVHARGGAAVPGKDLRLALHFAKPTTPVALREQA